VDSVSSARYIARPIAPEDVPLDDGVQMSNTNSPTATSGPRPPASSLQPKADAESRAWVRRLSADGALQGEALEDLHELLVRAARSEVARRRPTVPHLRGNDLDDLAQQSADDALVAVLGKLDDFRGESRFTTWAYKFALLEAAVTIRRLSWQGRELPLQPELWALIADSDLTPQQRAETRDLFAALQQAITDDLSPHQREVLVAVTLNAVPIDVLAERLNTSRGAVYKTLHDGRRKLRAALLARGFGPGPYAVTARL
jgi:RNA polymerase sigma-70 factor, ECF subfamily